MSSAGAEGRWTPQDGYRDILCDEDYEKFYRTALGAGRKLPPPLDQRTLYNELPAHLLQSLTPQQTALAHQALATPPPNSLLGVPCSMISAGPHGATGMTSFAALPSSSRSVKGGRLACEAPSMYAWCWDAWGLKVACVVHS